MSMPILKRLALSARALLDITNGVVSRTPEYFRTYDQMVAEMHSLQQQFPELVTLRSIGTTREGRSIIAMRLTNSAVPTAKPLVTHLAGVHAREIANPAMTMRWARDLLEGFGSDAESTGLLNTTRIDIIPVLNVDGHVAVERGFRGMLNGHLMQRRNADVFGGVDLNRNFDDGKWGTLGASKLPFMGSYRGPSAASEPETQALQRYLERERPSTFMDWHSFGRIVGYPPGATPQPAPDVVGLRSMAERFAERNGYTAEQSVTLYPTTGTTDSYAYERLRIPSVMVETGMRFHQTDAQFAETYAKNAPVLSYAAKIAADPYRLARTADVTGLAITARSATDGVRLTGLVTPHAGVGDAVVGAELVADPFAAGGSGIPLQLAHVSRGTADLEGTIGREALAHLHGHPAADGQRQLAYVRARTASGAWSPLSPMWLPTHA